MIGSTLSVAGQSSAPVSSEPVQKQEPVQKSKQHKKLLLNRKHRKKLLLKRKQLKQNHLLLVKVYKEMTVTATAYTANDGGISGITATGVNLNKTQMRK